MSSVATIAIARLEADNRRLQRRIAHLEDRLEQSEAQARHLAEIAVPGPRALARLRPSLAERLRRLLHKAT